MWIVLLGLGLGAFILSLCSIKGIVPLWVAVLLLSLGLILLAMPRLGWSAPLAHLHAHALPYSSSTDAGNRACLLTMLRQTDTNRAYQYR